MDSSDARARLAEYVDARIAYLDLDFVEVATEAGVDPETLRLIRKASPRSNPRRKTLRRLDLALDLPVGTLFAVRHGDPAPPIDYVAEPHDEPPQQEDDPPSESERLFSDPWEQDLYERLAGFPDSYRIEAIFLWRERRKQRERDRKLKELRRQLGDGGTDAAGQ